jgi:DNA adenine methylase
MKTPSPFTKWAGGKGRLLDQFAPYFPARFTRYVEPFVGGGAVFFHFHNQGWLEGKRVTLIDHLEELINCYRVIQAHAEQLIVELRGHETHKQDATYFYEIRSWDRRPGFSGRQDVERAARFLFLNRVCYNGLYRVNRRGEFNVPFGRHGNPTVCNASNLLAVSQALQTATLLTGDFSRCLELAQPGDFFYLDPPYHPLSDTSYFTSYTSNSFGADDQRRLASLFRELDRKGCQLMLSNSHTDLIQDLYSGYEQIVVHATRAISSKGDGRTAIPELLVLNGYAR